MKKTPLYLPPVLAPLEGSPVHAAALREFPLQSSPPSTALGSALAHSFNSEQHHSFIKH